MSKKKHHKSKAKDKKKVQKEKNAQTNYRWVLYSIIIILSFVFAVLALFWFPGDVYYEITETYRFEADEPANINLTLLLPTSGAYQEVLEPDISWPGEWQQHANGRLDIYEFTAPAEPEQPVEAVIQYRVHLWQGTADWGVTPVSAADLLPSEDIQSDHPDIVAQAQALTAKDDERQTAKNIFEFTINHLDWPEGTRVNADLSALTAYQSGIGGCEEHANLMTALSRAAGLPAHTVNGLAMPESIPFIPVSREWDHPAGAHGWVEILVDGVWLMADPSWSGPFYKHDLFGWTDAKHLVYEEASQFSFVYQNLLLDAEKDGEWIAAMSAPMKFIAWSDLDEENISFTPQVTLRKVWDARWLMLFSSVIILVVLGWVILGKRKSKLQI